MTRRATNVSLNMGSCTHTVGGLTPRFHLRGYRSAGSCCRTRTGTALRSLPSADFESPHTKSRNYNVRYRGYLSRVYKVRLLRNYYVYPYHSIPIDPSGVRVRVLPVAAGQNRSGHDKGHFGQSRVNAPALRCGHSTWHYFSFFFSLSSEALSFLPERR